VRRPLAGVWTLAALAVAAAGCGSGSGGHGGTTAARSTTAQRSTPSTTPAAAARTRAHPHVAPSPAQTALGLPPVPRGPVPGYVLIADRNNNRLLIVSPQGKVVWSFPHAGDVRPGQSFHDPDDAFFVPGYRRLITNEEFNDSIAQIDLRTRRIVWSYGRPGVAGSGPGELSNPDDAYRLPNGVVQVADIQNCRVLRISESGRVLHSFGSPARCYHAPPAAFHSPNGATPLPDGGTLVTEIGGWVDRLDARGRLVFAVRTPTTYPSDAQLLANGNILVAGFNTPGRVDEITPRGRIVWTYGPPSGPGSLDRPSLAVRWPNGMIAVTDDWHHRVVVIDPRTKQIVWQYGHFGVASSRPGYLSKPDGLDLLPARFLPPVPVAKLRVRRVGSLPLAASRLAVAALPGGRLVALGGLAGGSSSPQIVMGKPGSLRTVGRLPVPTHDAAAALVGRAVYLFGGGEQVSSPSIERVDPATGRARSAGTIGEPLSDLGAVSIGGSAYLVGGYTGSLYATAILRYRPGRPPALVARLPTGVRYAGVAALGNRIYVAGGVTTAGTSAAVYAVDARTGTVTRVATLPEPVAHAPLVAVGGRLYLVGGSGADGRPRSAILGIDPAAGSVAYAGRLPVALADAAAVSVGRTAVVLGGQGATSSSAVYRLRPALH
jgi:outer membrane protein assembly factor BamB